MDALIDLGTKDDYEYYVVFDYVIENYDIRNKYHMLKSITDKSEGKSDNEKTLQNITGFKRYFTECVMKFLVGEFTQSEKWSVKGALMGECWKKVVCWNIRIILSMVS